MKQSLSIIIPAYNEERYLSACLDAIAAQTVAPDQVIVVDNNSTDTTVRIAKRYAFVTVVVASRQGIVHARDAGFNAATSSIIGRIDADTILDRHWVDRTKTYFAEHPEVSAVTGQCHFYDAPFSKIIARSQAMMYHGVQPIISGTQILWGSNMALRRSAWLVVGDHNDLRNDIDEDIMLSLRLDDAGLRIERNTRMTAGVSLRRGKLGFREMYAYLSTWPRNYRAAGRPLQSIFIASLVPAAWLGGVIGCFMHRLLRLQSSRAGLRVLSASLWR